MTLARDQETLRIPAFMRKKNLSARLRKPLVLTAFDRKKAGIASKVKTQKSKVKTAAQKLKSDKTIGAVTHYYDKMRVGVIKLTGALSVGDCITYETAEGPYEQIVESMEIDRQPVFKAGRGKEIGLKLSRIPRIGARVLK